MADDVQRRLAVLEAALGVSTHECPGDPLACKMDGCVDVCPMSNNLLREVAQSLAEARDHKLLFELWVEELEHLGVVSPKVRERARLRVLRHFIEKRVERTRAALGRVQNGSLRALALSLVQQENHLRALDEKIEETRGDDGPDSRMS